MKLLKVVGETIPAINKLIEASSLNMALDLIGNADEIIRTKLNGLNSTK